MQVAANIGEFVGFWTYVLVFIIGMAVGAVVLDRVIRHKYGKNYARWIKDDFDLQWQIIRDTTYSHHFSPFSEVIQKISPQFCALYCEASVAEKARLTSVAGLSYGKSLECLIKDYAKLENPGRDSEIESASLSAWR